MAASEAAVRERLPPGFCVWSSSRRFLVEAKRRNGGESLGYDNSAVTD